MTETMHSLYDPVDSELFHVVFSLHPVTQDFFVAGIFSMADDAENVALRYCNDERYCRVAKVQIMPMAHVIDVLIKDRLGNIAELVQLLASRALLVDTVNAHPQP